MLRALPSLVVAALLGCATTRPSSEPSESPAEPAPAEPAPPPNERSVLPPIEEDASEPSEPQEPEGGAEGYVIRGHTEPRTHTATVPTVERSEVVVGTPPLAAAVIRRVIRTHIDALRACYGLGLDVDPTLVVRIAIDFTIGPTGKVEVAHAIAPQSFAYPEIPICLVEEIETWSFPAPRGGARITVSYPFSFLPE